MESIALFLRRINLNHLLRMVPGEFIYIVKLRVVSITVRMVSKLLARLTSQRQEGSTPVVLDAGLLMPEESG